MAKPNPGAPPIQRSFDEAKFSAMTPPFTVRIEKFRGSQRMPIPMPQIAEDLPPGVGWDVDAVRDIESWLVGEWAGGGSYEISLLDSSQPAQVMKWQPSWDPKIYEEKIPPPLQGIVPQIPAPVIPIHQQQGRNMSSFPNGLPGGGVGVYAQPTYPQQSYQQPPLPHAPMPGTHQFDAWRAEQERREREAEMKRLRDQAETREREAQESRHKSELDRERQANEARTSALSTQLTEMRNMFTALQASITQQGQAPRANAELEAIREQNRTMEARLERERSEREAERREAAMKEMLRTMNESIQRQIDTVTRQFDERTRAMEAAANNQRPDQFLTMWKESNRESADAIKELSRNQTLQMQALQSQMLKPQDVMSMARESTQSVDQAIERSTNFFGRVIETQQKVTENLLQMQPSGGGVTELIGNGIDRVGSAVEKYIGGKQLEAQLTQQGQVAVAQAQAHAYVEAARVQAVAQAPAGFAGAPVEHQQTNGAPEQSPIPNVMTGAQSPTEPAGPKRLGKTDYEWFGPILVNVQALREQAGDFIKSLKQEPPRVDKHGEIIGLHPQDAAGAIIQAIQICQAKQIAIPAMMELLYQHRFADFVDVVLPNVTQPYRDEVTEIILKAGSDGSKVDVIEAEPVEDSPAEDDDDDSDDDNADDEPNDDRAIDGHAPAKLAPKPKMRIVTRNS